MFIDLKFANRASITGNGYAVAVMILFVTLKSTHISVTSCLFNSRLADKSDCDLSITFAFSIASIVLSMYMTFRLVNATI